MTTVPASNGDQIALAAAIVGAVLGGAAIGIALAALNARDPKTDGGGRVDVEIPKRFQLAMEAAPKALNRELRLRSSVTYRDGGDPGAGLMVVGEARSDGPTLLPEGLASTSEPEVIGHFTGWKHTGLIDPATGRAVTIYAVPTTAYIAEVICVAPSTGNSAKAFAEACGHAATTIEVAKAKAVDDDARMAFRSALDRVVGRYDRGVVFWRAKLRVAKTATGQAHIRHELEHVVRVARHEVRALPADPYARPAQRALLQALDAEADAYHKLSKAAAALDERSVGRAEAKVEAARPAVAAAIARTQAEA